MTPRSFLILLLQLVGLGIVWYLMALLLPMPGPLYIAVAVVFIVIAVVLLLRACGMKVL